VEASGWSRDEGGPARAVAREASWRSAPVLATRGCVAGRGPSKITLADAPPPSDVTGLVICGGASRRMGRDKALLEFGGKPMIAYAIEALRPVAQRVVIATGTSPRYAFTGCESVLDSECDCGPLGGLLAGLEAARTEWVATLACDLPNADAGALRALLAEAARNTLDVCMLELERGSQPLFAVYRARCAAAVRAALLRGERRMLSFHAGLAVGSLAASQLGDLGESVAVNVNTPDDLECLERPGDAGDKGCSP